MRDPEANKNEENNDFVRFHEKSVWEGPKGAKGGLKRHQKSPKSPSEAQEPPSAAQEDTQGAPGWGGPGAQRAARKPNMIVYE